MLLIQLSSAQGPAECQLAVAKSLRRLTQEALHDGVEVRVVEEVPGVRSGTFRSVLLALDGLGADALARRWEGTVQWICNSPYRSGHARKNWFIGVARFNEPDFAMDRDIRFETMRASGPGGQHVNTTESAIRATHLASGISVRVQTERSQHANKRLAMLIISQRLAQLEEEARGGQRANRRMAHHQVARGDAVRVFHGEAFLPRG